MANFGVGGFYVFGAGIEGGMTGMQMANRSPSGSSNTAGWRSWIINDLGQGWKSKVYNLHIYGFRIYNELGAVTYALDGDGWRASVAYPAEWHQTLS